MLLEIRHLAKNYKGGRGLQPTSLDIAQGEWVAIAGHNGAGKSTLLKMLANWIPGDSGQVMMNGRALAKRTELVRKIGFVHENPHFFENFSVDYNLKLFARLFPIPLQRIDEILEEFELLPFRNTPVQALSKGLKQRVNISRTLLPDPPILLFDEPTSGLDFEMTREIYRLLSVMHTAGKTILFTTHRPEEIQHLATRILVLHQGSIVFDGSPALYFLSGIHERLYA